MRSTRYTQNLANSTKGINRYSSSMHFQTHGNVYTPYMRTMEPVKLIPITVFVRDM